MTFIHSLQSEWLKTKRSAASWLCIIGSAFLPVLFLISFLKDHNTINDFKGVQNGWIIYCFQMWKFMALAILPFGVILSSTLIAQLEYKNNTWKQLHTTPQHLGIIFFAKLSAIVLMLLKFFIFFNAGIVISACIPSLLFDHKLPIAPFPVSFIFTINAKMFVSCLSVIAIQYLISLQFKNFLIPIGIGFLILVGSIILVYGWEYAFLSPYSYTILLISKGKVTAMPSVYACSMVYFVGISLLSYYLYLGKKDKS